MTSAKMCPVCGTTYGPDHLFCPRDSSALRSADETDDLIGTVIGQRYLLIERIGAGGMGEVYKAQDVRLPRVVAVKVVRPHLAGDADSIARVIREAANGSRIRHSNVVDISDYGETADGRPYLAMEFIAGESLRSLLDREGALDPRRAAALLLQIASGLDAAHRLGIVHRDVKPDNVLVHIGEDGSELAKVVDFGISRAVRDESQRLTRTGFITGTCEFMSPEQVAGRAFDHHSDIYSLGLVAFQMLTGGLPFSGDTPELAMLARLHEPPRRLDQLRPSGRWGPDMQDAIDRALALEVGQRFDSAGAFARALSAAANQAAGAAPVRRRPSSTRWKRSLTVAGLMAAAAMAAVVWDWETERDPSSPSTRAPTPPEPPPETGRVPGGGLIPIDTLSVPQGPGESDGTSDSAAAPKGEKTTPAPNASQPPHDGGKNKGREIVDAFSAAASRSAIDAYENYLQPGIPPDSARRAIASLDSLIPRLSTRRDSAEAEIYRAEAYALAGDFDKACTILEAARPRADSLQLQKMDIWSKSTDLCEPTDWKSS